MEIQLTGFETKEIQNISGKGVSFKKIKIPKEHCNNFFIKYEITNLATMSKLSGPIHCIVNPYQRDVSEVMLNKSLLIPENGTFKINLESISKPSYKGIAFIEYEIFSPTDKIVFITEKDRQDAFRVALINLARFFKIQNWEYENNKTLYDKIKTLDNPIVKLLKNYFIAYDDWFSFYEQIKSVETESGVVYDLSEDERNKLSELIQKRQETLDSLQAKFDELQFERFKQDRGLDNVDGIIL